MANSQLNDQDTLRILWAKHLSKLPTIDHDFVCQDLKIPIKPSLMDISHQTFKSVLGQLTDFLPWDAKLDDTGQEIQYAWVDLIGPDSVQYSDHFRIGLFWQNNHVTYPRHHHNGVELYYVLSGVADWQQGDSNWFTRPVGSHFLHQSQEAHATRTGDKPLLTLWAWHGDLSWDSYQIES